MCFRKCEVTDRFFRSPDRGSLLSQKVPRLNYKNTCSFTHKCKKSSSPFPERPYPKQNPQNLRTPKTNGILFPQKIPILKSLTPLPCVPKNPKKLRKAGPDQLSYQAQLCQTQPNCVTPNCATACQTQPELCVDTAVSDTGFCIRHRATTALGAVF